MSLPNSPTPAAATCVTLAARCKELADKATAPADKQHWLEMVRFWSDRSIHLHDEAHDRQVVEL
jgi:hypothetical protein